MSDTKHSDFLRYPVGRFKKPESASQEVIHRWSETISSFPEKLAKLTEDLTEEDLNRIYRPGSWNVRQIVHHCADSHMNAFIRFKLTLTEEVPTIKPFHEDRWAELADSSQVPVNQSLSLLKGLHSRWAQLLKSMRMDDFNKELHHPEHNQNFKLWEMLSLYAWHCDHHLAHVKAALGAN